MQRIELINYPDDRVEMEQRDNLMYMHFSMLNGMARISFELTRDEAIAIASFVAATALGGNWK